MKKKALCVSFVGLENQDENKFGKKRRDEIENPMVDRSLNNEKYSSMSLTDLISCKLL